MERIWNWRNCTRICARNSRYTRYNASIFGIIGIQPGFHDRIPKAKLPHLFLQRSNNWKVPSTASSSRINDALWFFVPNEEFRHGNHPVSTFCFFLCISLSQHYAGDPRGSIAKRSFTRNGWQSLFTVAGWDLLWNFMNDSGAERRNARKKDVSSAGNWSDSHREIAIVKLVSIDRFIRLFSEILCVVKIRVSRKERRISRKRPSSCEES